MSLFVCLFVAVFSFATAAPVITECAGGFHEGDVVDKGVYWYKCSNGVLAPQGCLTSSTKGKRVLVGESFVNDKNIEITCTTKDDQIQFTQTACMNKGQRVAPDQSFEGADAWYVCERANQLYLLWKAAGCMHNGQRLHFYDRVREEGSLYECQRSATTDAQLTVVGCTNGQEDHLLGEQYQDDTTLYTCDVSGGKAVQHVMGCVHNGQRYYDYQVYTQDNQVIRCVVNAERTEAKHQISGCIQQMKNRPAFQKNIGCFWDQEDEDKVGESYLMNCKQDATDGHTYAERVRCLYHDDAGIRMEIDPGCFRNVAKGTQSVGCVAGEQGLQITTFPSDRLDLAFSNRLKFC